jgi:hypothetical protein
MRAFLIVLLALVCVRGFSQKMGFEINVSGGIGHSSWATDYQNVDFQDPNDNPVKGSGPNLTFQFSTLLTINRFKIGPSIAFRNYTGAEMRQQLQPGIDRVIQYGIIFQYVAVKLKRDFSLSPSLEVGTHTVSTEYLMNEYFANKMYGTLGVSFSKSVSKFLFSLTPNANLVYTSWPKFKSTKGNPTSIFSANIELGVGYKIR